MASTLKSGSALIAAAATLGGFLVSSEPADARRDGSSVTACSRYGNGCYSAPTRYGRFGREMRLKGGTWIDCKGSCNDTLREETVDFWETLRERSGGRR